MRFLQYLEPLKNLFSWYFKMKPAQRIQFNYIVVIVAIVYLSYLNDDRHRTNYSELTKRNFRVDSLRSVDQARHTEKLESYTDKFNGLLEKLIDQEKQIDQITKEK